MKSVDQSLLIAIVLASIPATSLGADADAECSGKNAQEASVFQVASHPERYYGRCVAISGVMQRAYLYESVDGVYLRGDDLVDPSSSGFVLGLHNIRRHFDERYRHVSIVGRVQDCEEVREMAHSSAGENEFVMVSGYCHNHNGAYLWVNDLRVRNGPPLYRQMGHYERRDYGDLRPVPEGWPHRANVEAQASKFLAALRANDRETLIDIHYGIGLERKDEEAETLRFLLSDRKSPFASIRTSKDPPQLFILVYKPGPDPDEDEVADALDANGYDATICFCRQQDCTGRWPIASFDANNLSDRPYACTELTHYGANRHEEPHFNTRIGKAGLKEPRATD